METERSGDPHRESKPSTQHPHRTHRTHDTTDQWREIVWWLGRTRRIFLLLLSARRVSRLEYMGMYFMHVFCTRLTEY